MVCLLSCLAGVIIWVGGFWRFGPFGGNGSALRVDAAGGDPAVVERFVMISRLSGSAVAAADTGAFGPSVRAALRRVLRDPDADGRRYAFRVILSALSLKEIGDAVGFLEGLAPGETREEFLLALLHQWGTQDGRSALAFAVEHSANRVREEAVIAALSGWARERPADAWGWAVEHPGDDPFQSRVVNAVIAQIAAIDAQSGFAYALAVPTEANRAAALETVADTLFASGQQTIGLSWFADLPEGAVKQSALEHVAALWSRYEPVAAAEWIAALPGATDYHMARMAVASAWAVEDSVAAAEWAVSLAEGRGRANAVEAVFDTWVAQGDVRVAAQWLNQLPADVDFDRAVEKIAFTLMDDDPETAMTWADSIFDERLRLTTMALVGSRWMGADSVAATEFMESNGLSVPIGATITDLSGHQVIRRGDYDWTIQYQPVNGSAEAQLAIPGEVIELRSGSVVDLVSDPD